ncbi:MAG: hypothetical protein H8E39_05965 [Alphaproteobacteria bacterium]|nr:hypothetical protein [Alphaproteobacteria bacterium]
MKLTTEEIKQIHDRKGIDPIPEDYPPMSELIKAFGDHTFYLTADGLHIWESIEVSGAEGQVIIAVELASWANDEKSDLTLHTPRLTEITVKFADDPLANVAVA